MPIPVIQTFTSLQLLVVGEVMRPLQFVATETPSSWSATGTPAGLSFNTSTGRLTGTPSTAGLTSMVVTAVNGSGSSATVEFPVLIEESSATDSGAVLLNLDLDQSFTSNPAQTVADVPGLFAKPGDKLLVAVGVVRGGDLQQMDITNIQAHLRDDVVNGPGVELWNDVPLSPVDVDLPRYQITLDFSDRNIKNIIQAHEGDKPPLGTPRQVFATMDVTLEWTAPDVDGSGTVALKRTFRNIQIHLAGRMGGDS